MSVLSRILALLFVPKCVSCGERMDEGALCIKCRFMLKEAMDEPCPNCFHPYRNCTCATSALKTAGARRHIKLFPYVPSKTENVENRIIYTLKKHNYIDLYRFLTKELSFSIAPHLKKGDYAITYMPRSSSAISECGFDQSKLLAKEIAKKLDLPFVVAFSRKGNKKQKSLNRAERKENAEETYSLKKGFSPQCRRFLLVDDICTSGSTLAKGVKLLKSKGVKTVIPVSLGSTAYQEK